MLRFLTAGESHGEGLLAILEGLPAGLKVNKIDIDKELKRRQQGFGRGKRMKIEHDKAQILSGLKSGITLGSPVALFIKNKDASIEKLPKVLCPRPGHADLAGLIKYGFDDARCVLERSSARSTAATVGVGALCKILLSEFGIKIFSKAVCIGGESNPAGMIKKITQAVSSKDTLGGIFEVTAKGVPCGLGSYVHPDRRLNARLSYGVMSIPGIKGVEIGLGFGYADKFGSEVHDAIYYSKPRGYFHKTNNAGGIEGGISTGEDIIIRACMKPIPTLLSPLDSVNINTKKPAKATVERSDICVVEAAGVVAEAVVAFELAKSFLDKFGSDNLCAIKSGYKNYQK